MTKARTNADNVTADIAGITAGTGITGGGTSGTVTVTNSMATAIDAAGDLIYGTGSDAFTRLGLGTASQILRVNSGATAPEWVTPASASPASATASVDTEETTTNESFVDLTTSGPAVTLTTGTKVLIIVSSQMKNNSGNGRGSKMSYAVSGASSVSGANDNALLIRGGDAVSNTIMRSSSVTLQTVTAGSNTFTAKYAREGNEGTSTFSNRKITVIDLGS